MTRLITHTAVALVVTLCGAAQVIRLTWALKGWGQ